MIKENPSTRISTSGVSLFGVSQFPFLGDGKRGENGIGMCFEQRPDIQGQTFFAKMLDVVNSVLTADLLLNKIC